jgi:hypothetical protein
MFSSYYDIHGVVIEVKSKKKHFLHYCRAFLEKFLIQAQVDTPDIIVNVDREMSYFNSFMKESIKVGTNTFVNDRGILAPNMNNGTFLCIAEKTGSCKQIEVSVRDISPATKRILRYANNPKSTTYQNYMAAIRFGIILPVLGTLIKHHNMVVLHGSVVSQNNSSEIFIGLNGCGKSGLAWHLVTKRNYTFLSDNWVLANAETGMVYCFPEVLRLSPSECTQLDADFLKVGAAYGKDHFVVPKSIVSERSGIEEISLLYISTSESRKKEVSDREGFWRDVESLHRFLAETPEFSWWQLYESLVNLYDLENVAAIRRRQLIDNNKCFLLNIKKTFDVDNRYANICKH